MKELQICNKGGEVYVNDVQMGDGFAEIYMARCDRHNSIQIHLGGYNQGGHDGMSICLSCAHEVSSLMFGGTMDEIINSLK